MSKNNQDINITAFNAAFFESGSKATTTIGKQRAVDAFLAKEGFTSLVFWYVQSLIPTARAEMEDHFRRVKWVLNNRKRIQHFPVFTRYEMLADYLPESLLNKYRRQSRLEEIPEYILNAVERKSFEVCNWNPRTSNRCIGDNVKRDCSILGFRTEIVGFYGFSRGPRYEYYADYTAILSKDGRELYYRLSDGSEEVIKITTNDSSIFAPFSRLWALRQTEGEEAVISIIELTKSSNLELREEAVKAIRDIKQPAAVERLVEMLKNEIDELRLSAPHALNNLEDQTTVKPFIAALEDPSVEVRINAAHALGKIKDVSSIKPLCKALKNNSSSHNIWNAGRLAVFLSEITEALIQIGNKEAFECLCKVLMISRGIESRTKISIVADALGRIGDERAVEPLLDLMKESDSNVRTYAAKALLKIKGKKASDLLSDLLNNPSEEVRTDATLTLIEMDDIRGTNFFESIEIECPKPLKIKALTAVKAQEPKRIYYSIHELKEDSYFSSLSDTISLMELEDKITQEADASTPTLETLTNLLGVCILKLNETIRKAHIKSERDLLLKLIARIYHSDGGKNDPNYTNQVQLPFFLPAGSILLQTRRQRPVDPVDMITICWGNALTVENYSDIIEHYRRGEHLMDAYSIQAYFHFLDKSHLNNSGATGGHINTTGGHINTTGKNHGLEQHFWTHAIPEIWRLIRPHHNRIVEAEKDDILHAARLQMKKYAQDKDSILGWQRGYYKQLNRAVLEFKSKFSEKEYKSFCFLMVCLIASSDYELGKKIPQFKYLFNWPKN
ncbi:MAG TPA: HEAT repeat domain-containing protein [Gammaproteobacteria bacterium]|nr:HEAT repeat domain-containing protein [Gammaproteobacteria bacterium]